MVGVLASDAHPHWLSEVRRLTELSGFHPGFHLRLTDFPSKATGPAETPHLLQTFLFQYAELIVIRSNNYYNEIL